MTCCKDKIATRAIAAHAINICTTMTNDAIVINTMIAAIINAMTTMHAINTMIAMITMLVITMMIRCAGVITIALTRM